MDPLDFHFKHPITIQVSGKTRCGKTRLVRRILEEQLIKLFAIRIIWVFSEWQPDYDMIRDLYPGREFEKWWRDEIFDSISPKQRNILVLDDQMGVASLSTSVADLFTKESRHRNLTVIYLVQNVYNQGKSQRTISLNSQYSVVFRNGRDASQFRYMAYQICSNDGKSGFLILLQMPPTNLMGTWSLTTTHQHLKTRRSSPILYLESSLPTK